MPDTWLNALNAYSYPVNLRDYEKASEFPGFFEMVIAGDRQSTMAFERHYQETASHNIAAFFEVIYWKLYSTRKAFPKVAGDILTTIQKAGITSAQLWSAVQNFVVTSSVDNLKSIRKLLGISTSVLAVPLTLPALASPATLPMIDNQVANWVKDNASSHSVNRRNRLTTFNKQYTSLRQDDFPNYLHWVYWCRECAEVLSGLTTIQWRTRDVEMAVFTARRNRLVLNPLP